MYLPMIIDYMHTSCYEAIHKLWIILIIFMK